MIKRGEIRRQYGINGSMMGDCCVAYWCSCCASVQHDKEVKSRSAPVTQGYQPQPGMHMMPQPGMHMMPQPGMDMKPQH